jgi:alpha-glucuronidase
MANPRVIEVVAGSTIKLTFSNSGATIGSIASALINNVEAVVHSVSPVSSGNGNYYALHSIPNSDAWYVNEWFSYINASTYVSRQLIHAHKLRVNSL